MSRDDEAERGRAEPIDVEFEPLDRDYARGSGVGAGTALLIGAIAAGLGAAGGAIAPRVPAVAAAIDSAFPAASENGATAAASETDAARDQRLDAIEALINAPIANAASGDSDTAARMIALQASLQTIEQRLARMPSTEEVTALVAEVRRLQEDLPAVAAQSRTAAEAARAAFAVAAMADATGRSGPFEQSYASLQALLPEDANVQALAALARTGAPTRIELRDRFDRLDNEIVRAGHQAQAGAGFWGRIQSALSQWIVIRRAGEGDTPAGVVERAQRALAGDDLATAVQELNRLNGAPKRAADPWIEDAQRRLEIDERLTAIRTELSRRS